jgi:hypothetical protein
VLKFAEETPMTPRRDSELKAETGAFSVAATLSSI